MFSFGLIFVALISALVLFKSASLRLIGLIIYWGSPNGVQLFTECVSRHYIVLFYTWFCRRPANKMTMTSSQTRNLLRPNNLSGHLTDDFVNNFMFFFE